MLAFLKELLRIIAFDNCAPVKLHSSNEHWSMRMSLMFEPLKFDSRKSVWSKMQSVKLAPLKMHSSLNLVNKSVAPVKLPPARLHSSSRQFSKRAPSALTARMPSGAKS